MVEQSNDDGTPEERFIDESETPVDNGDFFSYDAPGFDSLNAVEDMRLLQGNFFEYMRVSFNRTRPGGDGVFGSRCSDEVAWHVRHTLVNKNGLWARSTGDSEETPENGVGLGHRHPIEGLTDEKP
jgi:hypothetical protein